MEGRRGKGGVTGSLPDWMISSKEMVCFPCLFFMVKWGIVGLKCKNESSGLKKGIEEPEMEGRYGGREEASFEVRSAEWVHSLCT